MKDQLLIAIILAGFAFGYYIIAKVDRFIDETQRLIANETRDRQSKVRIAAENPMLLDAVVPALEDCSNADPHLAFFLSRGRASRILEKLWEEQVDIVLLSDAHDRPPDNRYASLRVPCDKSAAPIVLGLPVENLDEDPYIRVVWKKELRSKDRDRVIFALENECCRLKCGYPDNRDGCPQ